MHTVQLGCRQRLYANFRDATGTLFDPTHVAIMLSWPIRAGIAAYAETLRYGDTPRIIRQSAGVYYLSVMVDFTGVLNFSWSSTGVGQEQSITDSLRAV